MEYKASKARGTDLLRYLALLHLYSRTNLGVPRGRSVRSSCTEPRVASRQAFPVQESRTWAGQKPLGWSDHRFR